MMKIASLPSRAVLELGGADCGAFLQNLVTCNVQEMKHDDLAFGALLSPQGKIMFDFFLLKQSDLFWLDCSRTQIDELARRLMFYRLRAKVTIEPLQVNIFAAWSENGDVSIPEGVIAAQDPRSRLMGMRLYHTSSGGIGTNAQEEDWHRFRIRHGMPQSELDFDLRDVFPHDVLMDQFRGVDFKKGCYVGQEVVSRMQHRGTARNRMVKVKAADGTSLPPKGSEILASDRAVGTMGSSFENHGIALVRLDRALSAVEQGIAIVAGQAEVELSRPHFAVYDWGT